MTPVKWTALALVLLATAFAVGRYSAPEKVRIEKEIVKVEVKTTDETKHDRTDKTEDRRLEKVITEVVRPDGTRETTTRFVENTTTNERRDTTENRREESHTTSTEKTTEETTRSGSRLTIAALAGPSIQLSSGVSLGPIAYGAHVQRNLLGPIVIGVWGLSNGTGGMSLGLTF